jgi:phosphate transport system substrate-binding protein
MWGGSALVFGAEATQVMGVGASFPALVYRRWAAQYGSRSGASVSYRSTGSGDGVQQISRRAADFGGTDVPLLPDELARRQLVQVPMLVGGIVPVFHLPELEGRALRLTGPLLADMMMARIHRWDDAAIAALNPGLKLPARRMERIGTTEGFSRYLAAGSPAFADMVGQGVMPRWPGEPLRAQGNDGVAALVRANAGSLGYVSLDRALDERLTMPSLRNRDGQWVVATEAALREAILNSDLHRAEQDTASLLDRPGPGTWPLTMASFVLVDAQPADSARCAPTLRFLYWCFMHGDELTRGTGFAPLPAHVQARLANRFAAVLPRTGGRPVYQLL